MNKNSKIGIVDSIIMILLCATADAAETVANLSIAVPIIGQILPFLAWFYGFTISAFMVFWLIMKGVSTSFFLGGSGIELIPFVNILPARTGAIIATIIQENLPEKTKKLTSAVTKGINPVSK